MKQLLRFSSGDDINDTYEIIEKIGEGQEGIVYLAREYATGIERTLKFFYPQHNKGNKTARAVARKLHNLRHAGILIQYYTQELTVLDKDQEVTFLTSEFIDGVQLSDFMKEQSGKRLHPFQALHLLHALVVGVEEVHRQGEYHADIHTDNIMVERIGLEFNLKLLDPFHWVGASRRDGQKDDIVNIIQVFYEVLGGVKYYAQQPDFVKKICCGMKRPLILKKFRTLSKLRSFIESEEW